jgi:ankyrin repeat protein
MCDKVMSATETADAVALIDQGADVHAKDNDGSTPLHLACANGHHDIAAMLRAKSAVD